MPKSRSSKLEQHFVLDRWLPAISPKSASDQNSVPVILLIVDLVSEDWEVVSEERLSPTVEA